MKKRVFITSSIAVVAILAWASITTWSRNERSHEMANNLVSHDEAGEVQGEESKSVVKKYESQEIGKYYEWIASQKIDPATGQMNMQAFNDAWALTKATKAMNGGSKMSASTLEMKSLGPTNQGGRTRAILIDKNNPSTILVASVGGGIYRTPNSGGSWFPVNNIDALNALPTSSLTQDIDGDIYAGTGERSTSASGLGGMSGAIDGAGFLPGNGIYKSTDGGLTFNVIPSTESTGAAVSTTSPFAFTMKMASKKNSKGIFAATNSGLRYSTDGVTFNVIAGMSGAFYDVDVATDDIIFAVKDVANVYKSIDGGATFSLIISSSSGLPSGSRKELSVSPLDPNYVYVVNTVGATGCLEGVYRSTNGGTTFTSIGDGGSSTFDPMSNSLQCQGTYDLDIAVDPSNKDRVFVAGVGMWLWSSTTGWNQANSFTTDETSPIYIHADIHTLYFHPLNPNILFIACDGGLHRSTTANLAAPSYVELNNLMATTQPYHMAASWKGYVISGNQDNGTQIVDYQQNRPFDAYRGFGGDGGYVEFSRLKAGGTITETPSGQIYRSSSYGIEGSFSSIWSCLTDSVGGAANGSQTCLPDNTLDAWPQTATSPTTPPNNPFVQPFLLWENWARPANADTSWLVFAAALSGSSSTIWVNPKIMDFGLSLAPPEFKIGVAPISTVSHFQMSADGKRLYVAGTNGTVVRFDNVNVGPYPKIPVVIGQFGRFTTLGIDKTDDGVDNLLVHLGGYVTSSDGVWYGANAQAMTTSSSTSNFQDKHTASLPSMPIYSGILDANVGSKKAVIGTDQGVWMTNDITAASPTWELQNTTIGEACTYCVRQEPMNSPTCYVLYFGTHGRGMWRSTTLTPSSCASQVALPFETSINNADNKIMQELNVYPNPMHNQGTISIVATTAETVLIQIKDISGKVVLTINETAVAAGNNNFTFDAAAWSNGMYFVSISNNKQVLGTSKFVVLH